jgi:hypothetical protein
MSALPDTPQKRTSLSAIAMSALCQKADSCSAAITSAVIAGQGWNARSGRSTKKYAPTRIKVKAPIKLIVRRTGLPLCGPGHRAKAYRRRLSGLCTRFI